LIQYSGNKLPVMIYINERVLESDILLFKPRPFRMRAAVGYDSSQQYLLLKPKITV